MDLGIWRSACGQHFQAKIDTLSYLRNFPAAEPVDEFDDHNRLYSLKYNTTSTTLQATQEAWHTNREYPST